MARDFLFDSLISGGGRCLTGMHHCTSADNSFEEFTAVVAKPSNKRGFHAAFAASIEYAIEVCIQPTAYRSVNPDI